MGAGQEAHRCWVEAELHRVNLMKTLCILLLAVSPAFAGVAKFSAKHIVKPAARAARKNAVRGARGAVKAVKVAAHVAY